MRTAFAHIDLSRGGAMKMICSTAGILLLTLLSAMAEDSITAYKVQGGPSPVGPDGTRLEPGKTLLAQIKGTNFTGFLPEVQLVVPLLGGEPVWWDVPPDASYVSVVVRWNDQAYTLNSCYPLYRDKATIAVTDIGLVAVSSRRDKAEREKRNSERYKALLRFFDLVLAACPATP